MTQRVMSKIIAGVKKIAAVNTGGLLRCFGSQSVVGFYFKDTLQCKEIKSGCESMLAKRIYAVRI